MMKSAVIFAPAAGVSPWEDVISEIFINLEYLNIRTTVLRCEKLYQEICPTMSAHGFTEIDSIDNKLKVCVNCLEGRNSSINSKRVADNAVPIVFTEKDYLFANATLKRINLENWATYEVDGFAIGKIAAYEFILNHKIKSEFLTHDEWSLLKLHLHNTLLTYSFSEDYFKQNRIDFVFSYNRYYSINNIFSLIAERYGAKVFTVQTEGPANRPNSRFHLFGNFEDHIMLSSSNAWKKFSQHPLSITQTLKVAIHLASQIGVTNSLTYSSKPIISMDLKVIYEKLKIKNSNPLVLIPTSSADERFALEFLGFLPRSLVKNSDSLLVLKKLVGLANTRPDLNFIFRVHPREFPNNREAVKSQHSAALEDYLSSIELPENIYLNLPDQNISLNNLAYACNYILNSTSSVGVELSALGLNVKCFTPDELYIYPHELNSTEINLESAIKNIPYKEESSGELTKVQRMSYRWIYFKYFDQTIPVSLHKKIIRRINKLLKLLQVPRSKREYVTKSFMPFILNYFRTQDSFCKFSVIFSNSSQSHNFDRRLKLRSAFEVQLIRFFTIVFRILLKPKRDSKDASVGA